MVPLFFNSLLDLLFGTSTYTGTTSGSAPEIDPSVAGLALGVLVLVLVLGRELRRRAGN